MADSPEIFVDFAFADPSGQIVLCGWSGIGDLWGASLRYGRQRLSVLRVDRYPREDLRSTRPMGFLLVFRPDPSNAARPTQAELAFDGEPRTFEIQVTGQRQLMEFGVNEAFFNFLHNAAAGHVVIASDVPTVEIAQNRLRPYVGQGYQSPERAVAFDRNCVSEDGAGFVSGWLLHRARDTHAPQGLILSGAGFQPLSLLAGAVKRPDLSGFSDRYFFDGNHGFMASYKLDDVPGTKPVLVMLFFEDGHQPPAVIAEAETLGRVAVLGEFSTLVGTVSLAADQNALKRALSGGSPGGIGERMARQIEGIPREAPTAVILVIEIDVDPGFLRDIVRRFLADYAGTVAIVAVGPPGLTEAEVALAAIETELAPRFARYSGHLVSGEALEDALLSLRTPDGARVVFARASTLHHARHAADRLLGPDQVSVVAFSLTGGPRNGRAPEPATALPAGETLNEGTAFALACPARVVRKSWSRLPRTFMTEEAHFRLLAESLVHAGVAQIHLFGADGVFQGQYGPNNNSVGRYLSRRDFDRAMRRAMGSF